MIKLFRTYNKAKDVFVRPKIKFYFGLWKNCPGLPFWRRGKIITLAKRDMFYRISDIHYIKTHNEGDLKEDGTKYSGNFFEAVKHKLPKPLKDGDIIWIRDIRKKLKKWGLSWVKPQYELPIWLSFGIFNYDVIYKWKYNDIRYEYPPQFTLVFFGLVFQMTLKAPLEDDDDMDDHYWESLLSYLYHPECKNAISNTVAYCGEWCNYKNEHKFFQLRKSHIKSEYHHAYDLGVKKYNKEKNNKKYDFC